MDDLILDFNGQTGVYFLRVPRGGNRNPQDFVRDYGFDLSVTASTLREAVLLTHEPYAAVSFWDSATERARAALGPIAVQIAASWKSTSDAHFSCPADKELWPFQKANLEYALARRNTLIGDEPGLGKTETAICFANELNAKRILVVVPAGIRLQWARRIREWTTLSWPYTIHTILKAKNGIHPAAEWTIVSYDLVRFPALRAALASYHYDLLILDEIHYLKTRTSKRTHAVFDSGIAGQCERIMGLSGTPLPNRPREAYTISRALCWDAIDWMSEDSFRYRFNPSIKQEQYNPVTHHTKVWIDERSGRHAELQNRLRANFMVRHLKRDVLPQLHWPTYDLIRLEEDVPIKQALEAENMLAIDPEHLEGADISVWGHIAAVRRQMGIAMAPHIAAYTRMLLDSGESKLVLFAWHIEVLDLLEKELHQFGVVRIDGSTSPAQKLARIDQFRTDPAIQIIIGNIQSMGTGTDGLQDVSTHALIAEPSWTPGENIQCGDRLNRGGQRGKVQIDIFVAQNSIAERVLATALRKLQVVHAVLDRSL